MLYGAAAAATDAAATMAAAIVAAAAVAAAAAANPQQDTGRHRQGSRAAAEALRYRYLVLRVSNRDADSRQRCAPTVRSVVTTAARTAPTRATSVGTEGEALVWEGNVIFSQTHDTWGWTKSSVLRVCPSRRSHRLKSQR